jgi:hypothetical protein
VSKGRLAYAAAALAASLAVGWSPNMAGQPSSTSGSVPKQVHLVADGDKILASNVRFNRFDELKLRAQEKVREQKVGEAVAVVVTNQRIIAYGVVSGWRDIDRQPNEVIESLSAQDFAGLIVTNQRLLNFNGESGIWGVQRRSVER